MGYFEEVEVLEQRRRKQHEKLRQMQLEKEAFIASAIAKVVEVLREFASKSPLIVPHKFVLIPTHRRKVSFFESTITYRPVIEMPDVMQVEFGINLAKYKTDVHAWNEVYIDKSGRYHACERILVPYGEQSQMGYLLYKGFLYERNLAKALFEAYLENQVLTDTFSKHKWETIDAFIDFLIEQLEDYFTDDK